MSEKAATAPRDDDLLSSSPPRRCRRPFHTLEKSRGTHHTSYHYHKHRLHDEEAPSRITSGSWGAVVVMVMTTGRRMVLVLLLLLMMLWLWNKAMRNGIHDPLVFLARQDK